MHSHYIMNIKLITSIYKTNRDIKLGDTIEVVENADGKRTEVESEGGKRYEYECHKRLDFEFNNSSKVESIRMYIAGEDKRGYQKGRKR